MKLLANRNSQLYFDQMFYLKDQPDLTEISQEKFHNIMGKW